jgi:hypothetical protein
MGILWQRLGLMAQYLNLTINHVFNSSLPPHFAMPSQNQNVPPASTGDSDAPPSYASRCQRIYDELVKDLRCCPKRKQDRVNLEGFVQVAFPLSSPLYLDLN